MAESPVYKPNAHQQGVYTEALGDYRRTNAVRVGHYYIADDTELGLKAAVDAVKTAEITAAGGNPYAPHPENSTLPLRFITAQRVAKNIVKIVLRYDRQGLGSAAAAVTRSTSAYVSFKTWQKCSSYDANMRPNGGLNTPSITDPRQPPVAQVIQMPAQVVRLASFVDTDPTATVLPRLGTLNNATVVFAGNTYPVAGVRFDWFTTDSNETESGGDDVAVEYTFLFRPSLWVREVEPVFKWVSGEGYKWVQQGAVSSIYEYDGVRASFTSPGFPT